MKELGMPFKFRVEFVFKTNLKHNFLSHSQHRTKTTESSSFFSPTNLSFMQHHLHKTMSDPPSRHHEAKQGQDKAGGGCADSCCHTCEASGGRILTSAGSRGFVRWSGHCEVCQVGWADVA